MAHAYAKSRCGIKHRIDVAAWPQTPSRLLDDGVEVFNNELMHPTMEGPKFYKRNGWYYIFAPAGGVGTGWQVRSALAAPSAPMSRKSFCIRAMPAPTAPIRVRGSTRPRARTGSSTSKTTASMAASCTCSP